MTVRPSNKLETRFEESGSLPRPRVVGRIVRFGLGVWLLGFVYQLIVFGPGRLIDQTPPGDWPWWAATLLGIAVMPYLVWFVIACVLGSLALCNVLLTQRCFEFCSILISKPSSTP